MENSIDELFEKLGKFGRYQKLHLSLFVLAIIFTGAISGTYIFTALEVDYRCVIPGCEYANSSMLEGFLPQTDGKWAQCVRYHQEPEVEDCQTDMSFVNKSSVQACPAFHHYDTHDSILAEFSLECEVNFWMLTLVGTLNNAGQLVGLPFAGLVSDRLGRKFTMIFCMIGSGVFGVLRSFSISYIMFVVFEFLEAMFSSSIYGTIFVLAMELVQPSKRVLAGTFVCCSFAVGEILLGIVAMLSTSWRLTLRLIFGPMLLSFAYYWFCDESIRWLVSGKHFDKAAKIIKKIARANDCVLTDKFNDCLTTADVADRHRVSATEVAKTLKSPNILLRFLVCCFCWITSTFVFYGLTLNSVALSGDRYTDFILTCSVEIPAYIMVYLVLDRFGRRKSIVCSFALAAVTCSIFLFISEDYPTISLIIYLIGKFGATGAFAIIYVITSEIFPTNLRQSLMSCCSMFGRLGSIVAPQVPLLSRFWNGLPILLFSAMSAGAAVLSWKFPETRNTNLPDTIEEAENIGNNIEK